MRREQSVSNNISLTAFLLIVIPLLFSHGLLSAPALDIEETLFLDLINAHRLESEECWNGAVWRAWAGHESRELTHSHSLAIASENHNLAMINENCVEHQCANEVSLSGRVTAAGYPTGWTQLLENLAAGEVLNSAQSVFSGWRNSSGHNQAMLSCKMLSIGIARNFSSDSQYGWYWTTDFGDLLEE